jgi:hypothetical protein
MLATSGITITSNHALADFGLGAMATVGETKALASNLEE